MINAQKALLRVLYANDPGHRGLVSRVALPDVEALTRSLSSAQRVLVITGFPVVFAGGVGETDGPSGAAALVNALRRLGKTVWVATDSFTYAPVCAGCRAVAPDVRVEVIPQQHAYEACRRLLQEFSPTHVIALERPGKASDGHYHNFRGMVIDAFLADTSPLLTETDAVTIAVGDGGNELGMGGVAAAVESTAANGSHVCAREYADFTLVSGVSNWWGWGLAALLSLETGADLLPSDETEQSLIRLVNAAGGVDGISGRRDPTVDGLSTEENLQILRALRAIVTDNLRKPAEV